LVLSAAINFYYIKTNTSGESLGIYSSGVIGGVTILAIPTFAWIVLKRFNDEDFN
jgi:hypothetical protein